MGRIVVMNHVSLDGVMQGPGRPDEDTRDGFTLGGWGSRSASPDDAAGKAMGERLAAGGGLAGWLFGRWTYQSLLSTWNARGGPFKDGLNNSPKYVASATLKEPLPWPSSTLLRGDICDAVGVLTAQSSGVLAIMGSGVLIGSQIADCAAARIQRRRVRHGRINEYRPAARPPIASSREAAGKGHDEVMDPYPTPQQRHPGGTPEPRCPANPGPGLLSAARLAAPRCGSRSAWVLFASPRKRTAGVDTQVRKVYNDSGGVN